MVEAKLTVFERNTRGQNYVDGHWKWENLACLGQKYDSCHQPGYCLEHISSSLRKSGTSVCHFLPFKMSATNLVPLKIRFHVFWDTSLTALIRLICSATASQLLKFGAPYPWRNRLSFSCWDTLSRPAYGELQILTYPSNGVMAHAQCFSVALIVLFLKSYCLSEMDKKPAEFLLPQCAPPRSELFLS